MTLEELNQTDLLNSTDSLAEKGNELTSSLDFDSQYERGVINTVSIRDASIKTAKIGSAQITAAKINDFNFNQGTGGTLTLGGTSNGNGVMKVLDATGARIIQADNLGHHYYGTSGSESIRVDKDGLFGIGTAGGTNLKVTNGLLQLFNDAGDKGVSQLNTSFLFTTDFPLIWGGNSLFLRGNSAGSGGGGDIYTQTGDLEIVSVGGAINMYANNTQILGGTNGSIFFGDPINVGGVEKSAVVETKSGWKALYCTESPEVWFMDFCKYKDSIDPLFLEVTSPPYHFIKCDEGEYQVWGIRKGFENKRFESKSKKEAIVNNTFWLQALSPNKKRNKLVGKPKKIDRD